MRTKVWITTIAIISILMFNSSCSKDDDDEDRDTTAPVITILGQQEITIGLYEDWRDYVEDPQATASDNVDKSVPVEIIPDVDSTLAKEHAITYRAVDAAGNVATKERTVYVKLEDFNLDTIWNGNGNLGELTIIYKDTTVNPQIGNEIVSFTRFADIAGANVYMKVSGNTNTTITIPEQFISINDTTYKFSGSGNILVDVESFNITFSVKKGQEPSMDGELDFFIQQ